MTRLKFLRTMMFLSQQQLGKYFGVPQPQWSNWESGRVQPHPERQKQLASAFGVSPTWLFPKGE